MKISVIIPLIKWKFSSWKCKWQKKQCNKI